MKAFSIALPAGHGTSVPDVYIDLVSINFRRWLYHVTVPVKDRRGLFEDPLNAHFSLQLQAFYCILWPM